MRHRIRVSTLLAGLLALAAINTANADNVNIVSAAFQRVDSNRWSVNVTLQHGDTGWDHYANNWRIVDNEGNVLGDRVLYHPHVEEQPFTRGLGAVAVPQGVTTIYVEAHDKVPDLLISPHRVTAPPERRKPHGHWVFC